MLFGVLPFWFLCLLFSSATCVKACTKDELIMIQFLFNHGSSAPPELYPTDPNPTSLWTEGLGDLTMLGKFQPYALGSMLRELYRFFITADPREIDALSAAHPSAVKSALSFLASLYAPTSQWEVARGLPWQPIVVDYIPSNIDKHLATPDCPLAELEYAKILASQEAQAFLFKYQDFFNYWTLHSGWKITNWDSAALLNDVLHVEQSYNLTIPMWARRYWEELQYISDMALHWNLRTKLMQRLRGGPLVELIVDKLKKKAAGTLNEKKTIVYSTHAFNIASFLTAFNLFNGREPPFSTTIVIELYKELNEHYVRFLFMNSTSPETEPQLIHALVLDGCTEFCPLDYVVDYTKDVIPTDWEAECKRNTVIP